MDPILHWFSSGVAGLNVLLALRRWWRKRKGIAYEPITQLRIERR
jgi:hypothetical protein